MTTKQIKTERIAKLQAMLDIIQTKVDAMRHPITKETPYMTMNKNAKAIAWDILINDLLLVDANIHNASLGYVDVEAVRLKVSRSL